MSYFYFEPRTGIVKDTPIRSNFYIYRIYSMHRKQVEGVVDRAGLTPGGFEYPQQVLEWLIDVDTAWDQKTGLAL